MRRGARDGGAWHASTAGRIENVSSDDGLFEEHSPEDWYGAAATVLPTVPGLITPEELRRGRIEHVGHSRTSPGPRPHARRASSARAAAAVVAQQRGCDARRHLEPGESRHEHGRLGLHRLAGGEPVARGHRFALTAQRFGAAAAPRAVVADMPQEVPHGLSTPWPPCGASTARAPRSGG